MSIEHFTVSGFLSVKSQGGVLKKRIEQQLNNYRCNQFKCTSPSNHLLHVCTFCNKLKIPLHVYWYLDYVIQLIKN